MAARALIWPGTSGASFGGRHACLFRASRLAGDQAGTGQRRINEDKAVAEVPPAAPGIVAAPSTFEIQESMVPTLQLLVMV